MVSKFVPIKPATLKDKAMYAELMKGLVVTGVAIKKDYEATTRTWRTRPDFKQINDLVRVNPYTEVSTTSEIYGFVDRGTKPHKIFPRKARFLRFQTRYTAKTTPTVLDSKAGGSFGDVVHRQSVNHPGTQARKFTITIKKKIPRTFWSNVNIALRSAVKVSGHAI